MITRARSCFASHNQTNKQSSKQNKRFRAARARILPPALAQLRVRFPLHPPRARSSGGSYLLLPRKVIDVYGHLSISRSLAWSSACFFSAAACLRTGSGCASQPSRRLLYAGRTGCHGLGWTRSSKEGAHGGVDVVNDCLQLQGRKLSLDWPSFCRSCPRVPSRAQS